MNKYEMNWWGGSCDGDHRPLYDDEGTPKFILVGERMEEPEFHLSATVEASSSKEAWETILKYWPEAQKHTEEKGDA